MTIFTLAISNYGNELTQRQLLMLPKLSAFLVSSIWNFVWLQDGTCASKPNSTFLDLPKNIKCIIDAEFFTLVKKLLSHLDTFFFKLP